MVTSDIIQNVVDRVQDSSFTTAVILALINEGRYYAASNVDLPELRKTANLTTSASASSVALPTDYHKGIYWVGSVNQSRRIGTRPGDYYNMLTFLENYPVRVGQIELVCVDGANLLYNGQDTDTLTIKYYCKPTAILIANIATAVPSEIPDHLQRPLLTAYACKEIYSEIEDGIEGQKVNTDYWNKVFERQMIALAEFVAKNKPREARYVREMN